MTKTRWVSSTHILCPSLGPSCGPLGLYWTKHWWYTNYGPKDQGQKNRYTGTKEGQSSTKLGQFGRTQGQAGTIRDKADMCHLLFLFCPCVSLFWPWWYLFCAWDPYLVLSCPYSVLARPCSLLAFTGASFPAVTSVSEKHHYERGFLMATQFVPI